jgi:protein-L-isoaspartate(D-aspartate) O-methyltransferase
MDLEKERRQLIKGLRSRHPDIQDRVLDAMVRVPRHSFMHESEQRFAYADNPLSIGEGQTISAPHMVAIMCNLLELEPGQKVLEVGGGCGYHAAVMAELVRPGGHIYTTERIPSLGEFARKNLANTGYEDVTVIIEDGSQGLPGLAPFDRISVACSAPEVPEVLVEQLAAGGKMVIPVGRYMQELYLVTKSNGVKKEAKGGVVFVPLVGKYGF